MGSSDGEVRCFFNEFCGGCKQQESRLARVYFLLLSISCSVVSYQTGIWPANFKFMHNAIYFTVAFRAESATFCVKE